MKIKYCSLILLSVLFIRQVDAQENKAAGAKLHSINAVGLINGSDGASVSLQTMLGLYLRHTFTGIGVGLDYYRMRSVPIFVDLRYEFAKTNSCFFVYADAGYHFSWLTDKNRVQYEKTFTPNHFSGSMYYDAGIGYKIKLPNNAILLSGGYTYKGFDNKTGNGCPVVGPCATAFETYTYSLSRIILKVAYQL